MPRRPQRRLKIEQWPALCALINEMAADGAPDEFIVGEALQWKSVHAPGAGGINQQAIRKYRRLVASVLAQRIIASRSVAQHLIDTLPGTPPDAQAKLSLDVLFASLTEALLEPAQRDPAELQRLANLLETLSRIRKSDADAIAKERANAREQLREEQRAALAKARSRGRISGETLSQIEPLLGIEPRQAPA